MAAQKAAAKKSGGLVVTALLVVVKNESGNVVNLFQGDVVPEGTAQESIDHLRALEYVAESE